METLGKQINDVEVEINDTFNPLWLEKGKRYFILTGGRGSGKSYALATFLCDLAAKEHEKHTILYTRYTLVSAHISIIPEFTDKLELMGMIQDFKIGATEILHYETQSKLIFRGIKTSSGNQTASLKSIQGVDTWVLDEAEELIDEKVFDKIDESVREKNTQNRIILILNPTHTSHWIFKRWFENGIRDDTCYIHSTYLDNIQNLAETFIDKAERVKNRSIEAYKNRFLGEWMNAAEGVVFENWEEAPFDESVPLQCYGQDYGYSDDPTTLVRIGIDRQKRKLYLDECFALPKLSTSKIAELNRYYAEGSKIIGDSAEARLIDELKQYYKINIEGAEKGAGSITAGITSMLDYDIYVTERSTNLKRELRNYIYIDKKSQVYIDDYNHSIDAARYGFMYLTKKRNNTNVWI